MYSVYDISWVAFKYLYFYMILFEELSVKMHEFDIVLMIYCVASFYNFVEVQVNKYLTFIKAFLINLPYFVHIFC